jgi:hypothetical protein
MKNVHLFVLVSHRLLVFMAWLLTAILVMPQTYAQTDDSALYEAGLIFDESKKAYWEVDLGSEYQITGYHLVLGKEVNVSDADVKIELVFFNKDDVDILDRITQQVVLPEYSNGRLDVLKEFEPSSEKYRFVKMKLESLSDLHELKIQELEIFTKDPFEGCRVEPLQTTCSIENFTQLLIAAETFWGADLSLRPTIEWFDDKPVDVGINSLKIHSANHNALDINFSVGVVNANLSVVQTQAGDPELLLIVGASSELLTSLKLDPANVSAVGMVPLGFAHENLSTVVDEVNFGGAKASEILIGDLAAGAQALLLGNADATTYSDKYVYIDAGLNFVGFTSNPFLPKDMDLGLDKSTDSNEKIMITGGLGASSLEGMDLFGASPNIDQMHLTADIPLAGSNGVYSKGKSNSFGIKGEEIIASIRKDGENIAAGLHFLFELDINNNEALEFDARIEENYNGEDEEFVIGVDLVTNWDDPLGLHNTQVNNLSASLGLDDSGNKTFFGSAQVSSGANGEYVYKASLLGLFPPKSSTAYGFISMDLTESRKNHSIKNTLTKKEFESRLQSAHPKFSEVELPHFVSHVTDYGISISHELKTNHYSLTAYANTMICSKPIEPDSAASGPDSGGDSDFNVVVASVFDSENKEYYCPEGSSKTDLSFTISGSTDSAGSISSFAFKASADYAAGARSLLVDGDHVMLQRKNKADNFTVTKAHAEFSGQWSSTDGWSIHVNVAGDLVKRDQEIEFMLDFSAASSALTSGVTVDARFIYAYDVNRASTDVDDIFDKDFPSGEAVISNLSNFEQGKSNVKLTGARLEVQVIAKRFKVADEPVQTSLEIIIDGTIQWNSHSGISYEIEGFIDVSGTSQVVAFHLDGANFTDVLQHGGHKSTSAEDQGMGNHFKVTNAGITVFLTHNFDGASISPALQSFIDRRYADQTVALENSGIAFVAEVTMQQGMVDELGFANIGAAEKFIIAGAAGTKSVNALNTSWGNLNDNAGTAVMVDQYNAQLALELIVTNCEAQMYQDIHPDSCLDYQNNDTESTPDADYDNGFADWFNKVDALLSISIIKDQETLTNLADSGLPYWPRNKFDVLLEGLLSIHRHEDAKSESTVVTLNNYSYDNDEKDLWGDTLNGENLDLTVKGELKMDDGRLNLIMCAAINESRERQQLSVTTFETVKDCLVDGGSEYVTPTVFYRLFDFHNVLFKDLGIGLEITPFSIAFDARGKAKFHLPPRKTMDSSGVVKDNVVKFPNLHGMEIDVDNLGFEVLAEAPIIPIGFELDVSVDLDGVDDDKSDDKGIDSQEFHNLHLHTKYPITIDGDDGNDDISHDDYLKGSHLPRLVLSNYQGLPVNGLEETDRLTLRIGLSADSMFPAHFQIASGVDLYTTKSTSTTAKVFEIVYASYDAAGQIINPEAAPIISSASPYVYTWLTNELNISNHNLVAQHIGDFDLAVDSSGMQFYGSLRWGEDFHISASMVSDPLGGLTAASNGFVSELKSNVGSTVNNIEHHYGSYLKDALVQDGLDLAFGATCWRKTFNLYTYSTRDDSSCIGWSPDSTYTAGGFNHFNGTNMLSYGVDADCAVSDENIIKTTGCWTLEDNSATTIDKLKYQFNWSKEAGSADLLATGDIELVLQRAASIDRLAVLGADVELRKDSGRGFMGTGFKLDMKKRKNETVFNAISDEGMDIEYDHLKPSTALPGELFDLKSYAGFVDFDGDAKTDLVMRSSHTTDVFSFPSNFEGASVTRQVDSADFYFSSAGRDPVQQLVDYDLPPSVLPVGSSPIKVQFGDLNGDGKTDVVRETTNSSGRLMSLSVFIKDSGQSIVQNGVYDDGDVGDDFEYPQQVFINPLLTGISITNWMIADVHDAPGDEVIVQYQTRDFALGYTNWFRVFSLNADVSYQSPTTSGAAPGLIFANLGGTVRKEIVLFSQTPSVFEDNQAYRQGIATELGFTDASSVYGTSLTSLLSLYRNDGVTGGSLAANSPVFAESSPVDVNGDGRTDWLLPETVDAQSDEVAWNVYFCANGQNQITSGAVSREPSTEKDSCTWELTTLIKTKYAPHETFETGDFNGDGYTDLLKIQDVDDNGTLDASIAYGGHFKDGGSPYYRSFAPYKLNSINDVMGETPSFALGTANGTRIDAGDLIQFKFYQQVNQVQAIQ